MSMMGKCRGFSSLFCRVPGLKLIEVVKMMAQAKVSSQKSRLLLKMSRRNLLRTIKKNRNSTVTIPTYRIFTF